ncbi:serine hydrolase domain-containing protein [Catellatospora sichuanensis]|uniref:serine hydrolase domain-containing protein n=1 Tax=Catellatospora sichuanensis TaxID=1969805 RepID=UPI00164255AF|nr:serine hydrolase domain-containing protein [Catellatospora sichuanensis]
MTAHEVRRLARAAGYAASEPLVVGISRRAVPPVFVCAGHTPTGQPFDEDTSAYAASLSKQVTAALVALVMRQGGLAVDEPLSRRLPELPAWAASVRLRHLLHHVGGLPDDDLVDRALTGDRTGAGVLAALCALPAPAHPPGTVYAYSNTGYVCLAEAVRRAAGAELPVLAEQLLFKPLGLAATRFWDGPEPAPPGAAALSPMHPAPLSLGDGGVWSTAGDLLRWADAHNDGRLGVSGLLQAPGRLDDGTTLDYAWGVGVRRRHGLAVYRHGGAWPGLRTLLARVPDRGIGVVVTALGDDTERTAMLTDGLLDLLLT